MLNNTKKSKAVSAVAVVASRRRLARRRSAGMLIKTDLGSPATWSASRRRFFILSSIIVYSIKSFNFSCKCFLARLSRTCRAFSDRPRS